MFAGDIEVMYKIAEKVTVLHDERLGLDLQIEAEAALVPFGARLHPNFHDALAHRRLVAEAGYVTDGIDHYADSSASYCTNADSTG